MLRRRRFWSDWDHNEWLLVITCLVGGIPLVLYAAARLTGSLPSEGAWSRMGGNHGPWWSEGPDMLILAAVPVLLVMVLVTIASLAVAAMRSRLREVLALLALGPLQLGLAAGIVYWVWWTID